MRFSLISLGVVALATSTVADSWLSRAAYNKWHETELERWLSDHDIPYPKASDRKSLQNLVQTNWENTVIKPYSKWDVNQLSHYINSRGKQVQKGTEKNAESLISQVQSYWHETFDQANEAYTNAQQYIFDSWTDSQLKAFLDAHNIPNPNPRTHDSLLQTARSNYNAAATKAGETANYPGNWLYQSWSDSDLKAWLDERGIPAPQPSSRDKLIASLRRNSRIAAHRASEQYTSALAAAAAAQASLSDQLFDSWSDSKLKEFADKNGIKVPQGSKRNEIIALARKYSAKLSGDNAAASASSYVNAATSSAGNIYAQATDDVYARFRHYYDYVLNQFGLASAGVSSSLSSASSVASASLSSASSVASVSLSSASVKAGKAESSASKSASSASSKASKSGSSASSSASADVYKKAKAEL